MLIVPPTYRSKLCFVALLLGLGLLDGAVVEPQDDIVIVLLRVEVRRRDGDGVIGVVGEDGQRAGCIEADAADGLRVDVSLRHGAVHREADAAPDIRGGLLLCASSVRHWEPF